MKKKTHSQLTIPGADTFQGQPIDSINQLDVSIRLTGDDAKQFVRYLMSRPRPGARLPKKASIGYDLLMSSLQQHTV